MSVKIIQKKIYPYKYRCMNKNTASGSDYSLTQSQQTFPFDIL